MKGKQRIIKITEKHWGVKLLGALDYETGQVICSEEDRYDVHAFIRFFKKVMNNYTSGKIVMILDNSRIHHAKLLQPILLEHAKKLCLIYLLPYSPQLNLIEGLWGWLKKDTINNVFYPTVQSIKTTVRSFIRYVNTIPDRVI